MAFFYYLLFQSFRSLIALMPYRLLFRLGKILGTLVFFFHRYFRKKALNTLAIAFDSKFSNKKRRQIALCSFQNLMITCLEFCKLKSSRYQLEKLVELKANPEVEALLQNQQPIIFLSAHQANWEVPFLALTEKYQGIAIGRPIKNPYIYRYVLSMRQMHGGKIVMPKQAIREGLQALKEGKFLGIVGDQAYPSSGYSFPLFGTRAFTAATPALLAYKANCPIVVGDCKRVGHRYIISGSCPIYPNLVRSLKEELPRMMDDAMKILEQNILQAPEQWMWIHERYKQQTINHVKREYRYSFILVIFPRDSSPYLSAFSVLKKIYPECFLTALVFENSLQQQEGWSFISYSEQKACYLKDYRYQFVIDFTHTSRLQRHFRKLGAFKTLSPNNKQKENLPDFLYQTIVKKECLITDFS